MPTTTSRRGFVEGKTPEGRNPTSATRLKTAGRRREEEVAERLGKPVGDTEAGGLGTVGNLSGNRQVHRKVDVDSLPLMRCRGRKPQERCRTLRGCGAGIGNTVKEGRTPSRG
jgi:hypothetical protein